MATPTHQHSINRIFEITSFNKIHFFATGAQGCSPYQGFSHARGLRLQDLWPRTKVGRSDRVHDVSPHHHFRNLDATILLSSGPGDIFKNKLTQLHANKSVYF
jgi:hypothetical protein